MDTSCTEFHQNFSWGLAERKYHHLLHLILIHFTIGTSSWMTTIPPSSGSTSSVRMACISKTMAAAFNPVTALITSFQVVRSEISVLPLTIHDFMDEADDFTNEH